MFILRHSGTLADPGIDYALRISVSALLERSAVGLPKALRIPVSARPRNCCTNRACALEDPDRDGNERCWSGSAREQSDAPGARSFRWRPKWWAQSLPEPLGSQLSADQAGRAPMKGDRHRSGAAPGLS